MDPLNSGHPCIGDLASSEFGEPVNADLGAKCDFGVGKFAAMLNEQHRAIEKGLRTHEHASLQNFTQSSSKILPRVYPHDSPMRVVHAADRGAMVVAGKAIRELRNLRGWSQADLAVYARKHSKEKLSPKTVTNIEAGTHKPTIGKLIAIADSFDIEVWQLFIPFPTGLDEKGVEAFYRDLRRVVEYFRNADPDGRATILRVARNEQSTKLSDTG
jgi:transcriptional regulator with XRE-family HTH domain